MLGPGLGEMIWIGAKVEAAVDGTGCCTACCTTVCPDSLAKAGCLRRFGSCDEVELGCEALLSRFSLG